MAKWKLYCVLLLPLSVCFGSEETVVKTIGREPDVTPICTNTTSHPIILIVCRIRTVMSGEKECRLFYELKDGFKPGCDSRFALVIKNQTVFLRLINLTPVDSGDYTCECIHHGGLDTVHLNITVEDLEDEITSSSTPMMIPGVLIGAPTVLIITGVIFGFIARRIHHGHLPRSATSALSETPGSLDGDDPDDPYASLQRRESDVYQTISNSANNTLCLDNQEVDGGETDPSCDIYENI